MSFDELLKADVKPKEKSIEIELNGKKLSFKAVELSAGSQISVHSSRLIGGDWVNELIVASIIDPDGRQMTLSQAKRLPDQIAAKFFNAACEVNYGKEVAEEKN